MSKRYTADVTITLERVERDCTVRCHVSLEPSNSRGWAATLDGVPDACIDGEWLPLDVLDVEPSDHDSIEEALCEAALEDDSDQCVDHDDFEECCA